MEISEKTFALILKLKYHLLRGQFSIYSHVRVGAPQADTA